MIAIGIWIYLHFKILTISYSTPGQTYCLNSYDH